MSVNALQVIINFKKVNFMGFHSDVNFAAGAAVVVSSVVTIACVVAMTNPAITTAAMVAFGIFAALSTAASIAATTAWYRTNSGRVTDFATNFKHDLVTSVVGVIQFVSVSLFRAIINGCTRAVGGIVHDRIRYGR